jgi:type II secretory pathway component PulF
MDEVVVNSNPLDSPFAVVLAVLSYFVFGILPFSALLYSVYFLITVPMRRNERARLFLDLLELGLKDGHTSEVAIMRASSSHDGAPGARFHLLAAHLEQGMCFIEALETVPRLLSPRLLAILKVGARLGDIQKVFPACRESLRDGISHVRSAHNYLIILAFVITPLSAAIPLFLRLRVLPSFRLVFSGMVAANGSAPGERFPFPSQFIVAESHALFGLQVTLLLLVWMVMILYVAGPYLERPLHRFFKSGTLYWPWTRKRLYRDFSAVLAILLDAGVPEPEALTLAGESTASPFMMARAAEACRLLEQGTTLPDAVQIVGESRELRWRLSNAFQRGNGFLAALSGWHEALEAKAFQLEQSAAQVSTTALVILNGLMIGLIFIGVFSVIIALINQAVLW